jgi:hypothetical protein
MAQQLQSKKVEEAMSAKHESIRLPDRYQTHPAVTKMRRRKKEKVQKN